jgi:hypothetical protein
VWPRPFEVFGETGEGPGPLAGQRPTVRLSVHFLGRQLIWLGSALTRYSNSPFMLRQFLSDDIWPSWNVQFRRRNNEHCLTDLELINRHGAPPRKPNYSYTISSLRGQQINELDPPWQPQSVSCQLSAFPANDPAKPAQACSVLSFAHSHASSVPIWWRTRAGS